MFFVSEDKKETNDLNLVNWNAVEAVKINLNKMFCNIILPKLAAEKPEIRYVVLKMLLFKSQRKAFQNVGDNDFVGRVQKPQIILKLLNPAHIPTYDDFARILKVNLDTYFKQTQIPLVMEYEEHIWVLMLVKLQYCKAGIFVLDTGAPNNCILLKDFGRLKKKLPNFNEMNNKAKSQYTKQIEIPFLNNSKHTFGISDFDSNPIVRNINIIGLPIIDVFLQQGFDDPSLTFIKFFQNLLNGAYAPKPQLISPQTKRRVNRWDSRLREKKIRVRKKIAKNQKVLVKK